MVELVLDPDEFRARIGPMLMLMKSKN